MTRVPHGLLVAKKSSSIMFHTAALAFRVNSATCDLYRDSGRRKDFYVPAI